MTNAWLGTSVPYYADPCSFGARADFYVPRAFELRMISVWQLLDAKLARRGSLEQEFERRVVHPALSCRQGLDGQPFGGWPLVRRRPTLRAQFLEPFSYFQRLSFSRGAAG